MAAEPLLASLRREWQDLLASLGVPVQKADETFADLARCYSEPARHYHDLKHVRSVLDTIAFIRSVADASGLDQAVADASVSLAGWLHDVVYDPRAHDNEERSAEYARHLLRTLGCPETLTWETARLILLTKRHDPDPEDEAGKVLVDADLAILGAESEEYDRYAGAIREEYAWVPEGEYWVGRSRVLEGFLARPRIFHTEAMFARREGRARENLRRELERLRGD
jgi:predicted metal-dependent HD superfamily phosphohydrolase